MPPKTDSEDYKQRFPPKLDRRVILAEKTHVLHGGEIVLVLESPTESIRTL
jgi:hypothetical protein